MTFDKKDFTVRFVGSLCLSAILFCFIAFTTGSVDIFPTDGLLTATLFSILYFGFLLVLIKKPQEDILGSLFFAAAIAALVYARVSMLSHAARDYDVYLSDWLYQMRQLNGVEPLVQKIGDYNMPYLYFLFIVSKFNLNDLILIKWFSCIFDFLAAAFVMKIVALKSKNPIIIKAAFILALSIPTVLLNSSYWGQCDSILAAFCIGAVYFMLCDKPAVATVLYALAFSFKLQAIFMLPFMIALYVQKKVKPVKLLWFPVVFFAALLPAWIAGRPFIDCVRIYFDQASQYPYMSLNSPSFWQLFESAPIENFNMVAIMLTGIAFISYVYMCIKFKDKILLSEQVELAYLSAAIIPFLLPRMHDRYFFIADILSLCVFFFDKKKWYIPVITQVASLNCYFYYLFSGTLLFPYSYTTIALLIAILLSAFSLYKKINTKKS